MPLKVTYSFNTHTHIYSHALRLQSTRVKVTDNKGVLLKITQNNTQTVILAGLNILSAL